MGLSDKMGDMKNMADKTSLDEQAMDKLKDMKQRKKASQDETNDTD